MLSNRCRQMPVISVTLPSSILGATWTRSATSQFFRLQKSLGWTYRSCLKLESHRCTRPKLRGKKFGLTLVYGENSCSIGLFLSECLLEMDQRWRMEWAIRDFAPCERFLLSIQLIR